MSASRAAARILELRLFLHGVRPPIWRRVLVPTEASVADLHEIIQIAMNWQNAHLHRFHIRGRDYGVHYHGGIAFADDARAVRLGDLGLRSRDRFVYEYDLGDPWEHRIQLERRVPAEPRKRYPQCTDGQRAGPPEDCGGVRAFMELRKTLATHAAFVKRVGGRGDGEAERSWSDEDWDVLYSRREQHLIRQYGGFDPDRFRRGEVNRALQQRFGTRCGVRASGGGESR